MTRNRRRSGARADVDERGVYRFAPLDPRWTYLFRLPLALGLPIHRCGVFRRCEEVASHSEPPCGPVRPALPLARTALHSRGARLARRDQAAWTAGRAFASHLQRASRPPLPAQRLKTLIKRPSLVEGGMMGI
jgi:hypothetical protein